MKKVYAVRLYDKTNIDKLEWPQYPQAEFTKKYLVPLIKEGTKKYINNVDTIMFALKVDNVVLPVSFNVNPNYNNCSVCSPYGHYITYALDEISRLKRPLIKTLGRLFIRALGKYLKWAQLDKVVIVNNWLTTTNYYPDINQDQIQAITASLSLKYPDHAITFRSINATTTSSLMSVLTSNRYGMIVSRQVYIIDTRDDAYKKKPNVRKDIKKDMKVLKEIGYERCTYENLTGSDIRRLVQLYNDIYLKKYTYLNIQFTEHYFKLTLKEKIFDYYIIRKEGKINGFIALFFWDKFITSFMLGYSTELSKEIGLYRALMAIELDEAQKRGLVLNWGSGVAEFKCNRGAVSEVDYYAIYYKHLSRYRRSAWNTLAVYFNGLHKLGTSSIRCF